MMCSSLGFGSSGRRTRSLSVAMPSSSMADTWFLSTIQYSCSTWEGTGEAFTTAKYVLDIGTSNSYTIQRRMYSFFNCLKGICCFPNSSSSSATYLKSHRCVYRPCTLSSSSQTAPWKCCPPPPAPGPCASIWRRTGWLSECARSRWPPTDLGWWWGDGRPPARLHPRSFPQRWPSDPSRCRGSFLISRRLKFSCNLSERRVRKRCSTYVWENSLDS